MAMPAAMACRALREQRLLCLRYGGRERFVEVHVVGRSRDGRNLMRVWQVRGGSTSGELVGWKMLHLDEVRSGHVTHERSLAPRPATSATTRLWRPTSSASSEPRDLRATYPRPSCISLRLTPLLHPAVAALPSGRHGRPAG